MVLMTADLNDAQGLAGPVPKDIYTVRIMPGPNGMIERPKKGEALMAVLSLVIEAGEHKDHRIFPPYRVMVAGTKEDGTRHNLGRLCELLNATGVAWTCQECGYVGGAGNSPFLFDKKTGQYSCPGCAKRPKFAWDPDMLEGKRVRAKVDLEKAQDSDDMVNNIKGVSALM